MSKWCVQIQEAFDSPGAFQRDTRNIVTYHDKMSHQ